MKKLHFAIASVMALELLWPARTCAEFLYLVTSYGLVRMQPDGSAPEVITYHPSPHCRLWDFAIGTEGIPYITYTCTIPTYNRVVRLTNGKWEELFYYPNQINIINLELSDWLVLPELLYYAKIDEIRIMTLDRSFDIQLVPEEAGAGSTITGMDVDETHNKIYWVRISRGYPVVHSGRIMRADRSQPNSVETFVTLPTSLPDDVSVDEQNGMVYWSNQTLGAIQRAPVDAPENVEIVVQGVEGPLGVAVHEGKLYWVEGLRDRVRRSNLDGAMIEDVTEVSAPYRITFGPDITVQTQPANWGDLKRLYR